MSQIILPPLEEGQIYLYGRVNKNGDVEHTVLKAVNNDRLPHAKQIEWAESVGGVLMNRFDALVIYNEHRSIVKAGAYWTADIVEWDPEYAWGQTYGSGYQYYRYRSSPLRAVAVSRLDRAERWILWRRGRHSIS